ncbi:hypothetical protein HNR31_002962 [Anoxybacillus caldiproteolyticus]|uniref:Uncharacterized protein n=1 Tax=Thermaerobacillus caldiproteolyticus TaxID=247480 RepID=A0A7V9Z8S9_9BACL|nr:hypothetical protein [Anoxybacillus caldiproteolyticus]
MNKSQVAIFEKDPYLNATPKLRCCVFIHSKIIHEAIRYHLYFYKKKDLRPYATAKTRKFKKLSLEIPVFTILSSHKLVFLLKQFLYFRRICGFTEVPCLSSYCELLHGFEGNAFLSLTPNSYKT